MLTGLSLSALINYVRKQWHGLPDKRNQNNNNLIYSMTDVALAALSVFFMQAPSFLAYQRDMQRQKGKNNANTLFKIKQIPCGQAIRNNLDRVAPENFYQIYRVILEKLDKVGQLQQFRGYGNTELVGWDGFVFQSSTKIHCEQCSTRKDRNGTLHYYHSAITPVMLNPKLPYVLPLPPEFIVPQDGYDKQDCERAAVKRWLATHTTKLNAWSRTYLGDDLYANQPLCQALNDEYKQYFIFVCKPESHKTLYSWIEGMEKGEKVATRQVRKGCIPIV